MPLWLKYYNVKPPLFHPPLCFQLIPREEIQAFFCVLASQVRLAVGALVRFTNYGNLMFGAEGKKGEVISTDSSPFETEIGAEVDILQRITSACPTSKDIHDVRVQLR